jgi:hypothetical protein
MAFPTLVAFSEQDSGVAQIANGVGETSATLTWQAGDILIASAVGSGGAAGHTFNLPTNTGSGLGTWQQVQLHVAGSDCELGIWSNVATAGGSGTVTITVNISAGTTVSSMSVFQFRAPSGSSIAVGASGLGTGLTTSPQQKAITMSSADSAVVWVGGDWSAAAVETSSPLGTTHTSVPSTLPFGKISSGQNTVYYVDLDDETSTGSISFGWSGSSAGPFTIGVVEIKISATGAPPHPVFLPLMAPQGM